MEEVFVITEIVQGPGGHGEPGIESLALVTDGCWGIGKPLPAFYSREKAEAYRRSIDKYNHYKVIGLPVED